MQRLVINCQTYRQIVEDLTPEEETARLAEIAEYQRRQRAQRQGELKRLLANELVELREMQQNRQIFDDADITEKQIRIDELKDELQKLNGINAVTPSR